LFFFSKKNEQATQARDSVFEDWKQHVRLTRETNASVKPLSIAGLCFALLTARMYILWLYIDWCLISLPALAVCPASWSQESWRKG
jgi:hypothetical protein